MGRSYLCLLQTTLCYPYFIFFYLFFYLKQIPWHIFYFFVLILWVLFVLEVIIQSESHSDTFLASRYRSLNSSFSSALGTYLPEHICLFPNTLHLWLLRGTAVRENGAQTVISLLHLHTANAHMSWLTPTRPASPSGSSSTSHLRAKKTDPVLCLKLNSL